ncbi:MAG: hypothetical protein EAZ32_14480 [Cytophagia bacterium]|nr:MAG: hypothetical protein EAZ38_15510 [Cytophagales bacterium]TAG37733.1 MAG: hypothetical protein EAZ32_14480 [Cytophagia bacterium]TAG73410.1 MAG: hypothetical protein EAZ26_03250 [Runella slithyformis]TAG78904.1 MAG: hypothetical protein EAZ22_12650 [Cytophagales bacterium]
MSIILGIGSRIRHANFGDGVVINIKSTGYVIAFIEHGTKVIKLDAGLDIIEAVEPDTDLVSLFDVEQSLTKILQKWLDSSETIPLGDKWKGGKIILKPGRNDLSSKEMPIDGFFHKIVMMRDRLRVLEQRLNASALSDEDKVNMQQYITKIYGSMTSFNVLFKQTEHYFVGEKNVNEMA